jgi:hypothetical protein
MTSERLNILLDHPENVSAEDVVQLKSMIRDVPWFSAARTILAKGLHVIGDHQYAEHLHQAAIYSGSRHALFDLIIEDSSVEISEEPTEVLDQSNQTVAEEIATRSPEESEIKTNVESIPTEVEEDISYDLEEATREMKELVPEPGEAIATEVETGESDALESLSPMANWLLSRSREIGFSDQTVITEMPISSVESEFEIAADRHPVTSSNDLIDTFIENQPTITPGKVVEYSSEDLAKRSLIEDESIVTETMARIYEGQGKLEKARKAYKLLSLKYPEKSVYFANQLKRLGK